MLVKKCYYPVTVINGSAVRNTEKMHVHCTVKHSYNEHSYNQLKLTANLLSFLLTLLHVVKLMDITNKLCL